MATGRRGLVATGTPPSVRKGKMKVIVLDERRKQWVLSGLRLDAAKALQDNVSYRVINDMMDLIEKIEDGEVEIREVKDETR